MPPKCKFPLFTVASWLCGLSTDRSDAESREQWSRQHNMVAHLYCIPVDWTPGCSGNTDDLQSKGTFKILKTFPGTKRSAGFDETWVRLTEWISSVQLSHLSSCMCSVRETPSWPELNQFIYHPVQNAAKRNGAITVYPAEQLWFYYNTHILHVCR